MSHTGAQAFLRQLPDAERAYLLSLQAQAQQAAPSLWLRWRCGERTLGLLDPARAQWLAQHLPACVLRAHALVWLSDDWTRDERSEALQAVLQQARAQGLLSGWRNERFSFWRCDSTVPDPQQPAFLAVERSGFRWLGMRSHAVHVNGFLPDGRLWCARRALDKATDPGMLDNVTAGGLPHGETVQECLRRELGEEAGLRDVNPADVQAAAWVATARVEVQGWHDEVLHVFNLHLPDDFTPANQDGEVAEFLCLAPRQLVERIRSGAFTADAVQTLVQGLRYCA